MANMPWNLILKECSVQYVSPFIPFYFLSFPYHSTSLAFLTVTFYIQSHFLLPLSTPITLLTPYIICLQKHECEEARKYERFIIVHMNDWSKYLQPTKIFTVQINFNLTNNNYFCFYFWLKVTLLGNVQ